MNNRITKAVVACTLMGGMFAGLALSGCSTSAANVEPGLGTVHVLLKKRDQKGYEEACRYFGNLDSRTQNSLTPLMLKDENPLVVYLGASRLVREKMYDEAAPVMAELIVNGRNERELQERMKIDWRVDRNPATWPAMMNKVGRILMVNMESYQPDSKKRADQFLVTMLKLETNKPFNKEDATSALMKLSHEAKMGNS